MNRASIRSYRSLEAVLAFSTARNNALSSFRNYVQLAAQNASSLEGLRAEIAQLLSELNTAEQVAARLHQLAMDDIRAVKKFPDEDAE